jgi:phage/plasmid primase-like uncharacterized protein
LNLSALPTRREWRGDCPSCGYRAGFALKEKAGRALWWCVSCRDREAVSAAVRRALGWGGSRPAPSTGRTSFGAADATRSACALALWAEAVPLPGTIGEAYLAARGLPDFASPALRHHPACPHPCGAKLPALVALVADATTGAPRAIHRTYLRQDGAGKAAVEPQKATLGPVAGGVVMLDAPRAGTQLVVAEGIETAASAGLLIGAPAWSAVSAGNLAALDLPAGVARVVVAADPDGPGQRAAWQAAERWRAEGRQVRVATPDDPADDFNDLLRRRAARERGHGA